MFSTLLAIMPLIFPVAAVPPPSGPAVVAHVGANLGLHGGDTSATPIDTTGATFLVACVSSYEPSGPGSTPFSDSKSNTWTAIHQYGGSGDVQACMFVCYSPTVGSGHYFTYANGAVTSISSIAVIAFNGITTSAFDVEHGASASSTTTVQPGSVTPGGTNRLLITLVALNGVSSGTITVSSGFNITDTEYFVGGSCFGIVAAWKNLASPSAQNPTWTTPSATVLSAGIAGFAY